MGFSLKLAISNIIWSKGKEKFPGFLDAVAESGIGGVELALNAVFAEPASLSDGELIALQQAIAKRGLRVSALHSLTFTRGDLELFGDKKKRGALLDYLTEYVRIARLLKCNNLVFGSPSARKMLGRNKAECDNIFLEFLSSLDISLENVFLNIEPLHPAMCEYLHTLQEARELIEMGSLQNIKVQLDFRSCIENDESPDEIRASLSLVTHCQVSDPGLVGIADTYGQKHEMFAAILRDSAYSGFVAGEMLPPKGRTDDEALRDAVGSLRKYYGR